MDREQPPAPKSEPKRLRQSFEERRQSHRPVPYSVTKAYRLLIAQREDAKRSD